MTTAELEQKLCKDLVHHVDEWDGERFVVTNFRYPDGDYVIFYLESQEILFDASTFGISDKGITLFKCRENGVEITDARKRFVEHVCNDFDVELKEGILSKRLRLNQFANDALQFCEAISRISSLEYIALMRQQLL